MKTVYQDIAIEYDEQSNAWKFELRGRSRGADSLAKAKEAIDKEPVEKRKPFPKFEAWLWAQDPNAETIEPPKVEQPEISKAKGLL